MPSKFNKFKSLQQRMRRTMHYGRSRLDCLTEPLSKMVVDYFDKNCLFTSNSLDMNFLTSFSENNCINPCTLLIAMIYVERVKQSTTTTNPLDKFNQHCSTPTSSELFLPALILATKFLNDGGLNEFVWNDEFATASNFSAVKVNKLELEMLDKLNWNLCVDKNTFDNAFSSAEQWIAMKSLRQNGFLTYNEINVFVNKNSLPQHFLPFLEQFLTFMVSILITYAATVAFIFWLTITLPNNSSARLSKHFRQSNQTTNYCANNLTLVMPIDNNFRNEFDFFFSTQNKFDKSHPQKLSSKTKPTLSYTKVLLINNIIDVPLFKLHNVSYNSALHALDNLVFNSVKEITCY